MLLGDPGGTPAGELEQVGGGELELIEALLTDESPAVGRTSSDLAMPEGCTLFAYIRDGKAQAVRPDTQFSGGDKVIVIGRRDCEDALRGTLIGEEEEAAAI